jgi:acyl-CoA synthetase (AMP-forming)/AMP-acid ligase II
MKYMSLVRSLVERASSASDRPAVVFIHEDGSEEMISPSQFLRESSRYSIGLQQHGIRRDDIVLLVLEHKPALLYAFWGAMIQGAIPSIFPLLNEKLDPDYYQKQVNGLVKHSGARAVIAGEMFGHQLKDMSLWGDCKIIGIRELEALSGVESLKEIEALELSLDPHEKIALLQYSSGTTGLQKGVALSHEAVLNQLITYSKAIGLNDRDVIVSWLPLYHDMGLIAGFLLPLVIGVPLVLMSPFYWVRDPIKLPLAVARHKGTLSWLPNFAYNHMARAIRPRDLAGLDLSSWRMVINCSEPVRLESHQKFFALFSQSGLTAEALATCYAMAENTFAVTQSKPGASNTIDWVLGPELHRNRRAIPVTKNSPGAIPMVGCGSPIEDTEIRVVGPGGELLPGRTVGEIILRSSSMLSGYHRRPDLTARAIQGGWFYSGDLGYLAGGELFVTGRIKDLLIVGGKNIYPADLEAIASEIRGVIPGRAAAFGLFDDRLGTESIIMVCELTNGVREEAKLAIEKELRRRVAREMDVTLADVRLVSGKWLIKTSSGKIARSEIRDKYLREFADPASV